ncbi:hypothetical protein QE152_g29691 [Popillia japonica]|uniref:Double jelly roll-like domain-containing protein n=1 Tax=Popillia japonica TaxID=7064 RepID=A0AAW1JGH4_POPJA
MSNTFTLTGHSSVISVDYHPPIELDPRYEYALGLIGFHTYHTIANIVEGANKFYYNNDKAITIPVGAYEISDIETYLKNALPNAKLSLQPNNQTSKCEMESSLEIDFRKKDSIGRMLGFSEKLLEANKKHESDLPVKIIKVAMIRVHVPHVSVNDEIRFKLLDAVQNSKTISIPFRKWDLYELPSLRATTTDIWPIKSSNNLEKPRYVLVAFQKGKKDNYKADASMFDH